MNAYHFDEDLSEVEEDKEQETDDIELFQSEDRDDPGCECDDEAQSVTASLRTMIGAKVTSRRDRTTALMPITTTS